MSKLISININVEKIDKSKLYQGEKGKYLKLTASLNDEPDQYGNHMSVWQEQSKEERTAGNAKSYLGNGKVFWSGESKQKESVKDENTNDDLPF